jgi:hypothetical protein
MNALTSIRQSQSVEPWDRAVTAVNAWRGQAIHCFAQAEAEVSETLLALACGPGGGSKVRLRRLVGQRLEDLSCAVAPEGPFGEQGRKVAATLAAFREHESLRTFLCHGPAKITVDRQGQWVVILKVLAFRSRKAERSSMTLEERDAEALLADLRTASRHLTSALQSLRAAMAREEQAQPV